MVISMRVISMRVMFMVLLLYGMAKEHEGYVYGIVVVGYGRKRSMLPDAAINRKYDNSSVEE